MTTKISGSHHRIYEVLVAERELILLPLLTLRAIARGAIMWVGNDVSHGLSTFCSAWAVHVLEDLP